MKKVLVSFLGIAFIATNAFAANIITVDTVKLFNDYKKTIKYDEEMQKAQEEKENSLKVKDEELRAKAEELKLLKDDAKAKKEEELRTLGAAFQEEYRVSFEELKAKRDEKMQEVFADIEKAINTYAEQNKVDYVLKKQAVAYAISSSDKTAEVLAILNK